MLGTGGGSRGVGVQLQNNLFSPVRAVFQSVAGENRCRLNASVFPRAVNTVLCFLTSAARSERAITPVLKLAFTVVPEGECVFYASS